MSEQARIIAEIHEIVMSILKSGSVSEAEGDKIDGLEDLLHKQNCFKEVDDSEHPYQGEKIASLFFAGENAQAIDKMIECEITPDDFFGFVDYHYDDDHDHEDLVEMFTDAFIAGVSEEYQSKCQAK